MQCEACYVPYLIVSVQHTVYQSDMENVTGGLARLGWVKYLAENTFFCLCIWCKDSWIRVALSKENSGTYISYNQYKIEIITTQLRNIQNLFSLFCRVVHIL